MKEIIAQKFFKVLSQFSQVTCSLQCANQVTLEPCIYIFFLCFQSFEAIFAIKILIHYLGWSYKPLSFNIISLLCYFFNKFLSVYYPPKGNS